MTREGGSHLNLRWWLAPIGIWAVTVAVYAGGVPQAGVPAGPQLAVARTPQPATQQSAPPAGYAGSDTCVALPRGQRDLAQRDAARAGEESAFAGGRARLRELPRSGPGARRRRREGAHPQVRADEACRGEPDVPGVPQPRQSRGMGGQRARAPQSLMQHLPQRPQPEVGGTAARQGDRDRSSAPRATGCR